MRLTAMLRTCVEWRTGLVSAGGWGSPHCVEAVAAALRVPQFGAARHSSVYRMIWGRVSSVCHVKCARLILYEVIFRSVSLLDAEVQTSSC